jgi:prolipoprotein diacylglyceryltransferase
VIAFYLPGNLPVYAFSLLLGLGAAAGLAWAIWHQNERQALRLIGGSLWSLAGALLAGRAVYVLLRWPYYQAHLAESFQFHLGGLEWSGAFAGGLIFLAIYAWLNRQSFLALADSLVPQLMLVSLAVWIGCWLDGCAYGPESFAWWSLPVRDEWGSLSWRLPTQVLAALLTLTLLWLVDRPRARLQTPGLTSGLAVFGLMAVIFASSFLRADPGYYWNGLRLDAWAAFGFSLLAGLQTGLVGLTNRRENL